MEVIQKGAVNTTLSLTVYTTLAKDVARDVSGVAVAVVLTDESLIDTTIAASFTTDGTDGSVTCTLPSTLGVGLHSARVNLDGSPWKSLTSRFEFEVQD